TEQCRGSLRLCYVRLGWIDRSERGWLPYRHHNFPVRSEGDSWFCGPDGPVSVSDSQPKPGQRLSNRQAGRMAQLCNNTTKSKSRVSRSQFRGKLPNDL